jgi:hypothetical protein
MGPVADRLRASPHLQRIIERVHAAGPRPVGELLVELLEHGGADAAVLDHLEDWARINPDDIRALEQRRNGGSTVAKSHATMEG